MKVERNQNTIGVESQDRLFYDGIEKGLEVVLFCEEALCESAFAFCGVCSIGICGEMYLEHRSELFITGEDVGDTARGSICAGDECCGGAVCGISGGECGGDVLRIVVVLC